MPEAKERETGGYIIGEVPGTLFAPENAYPTATELLRFGPDTHEWLEWTEETFPKPADGEVLWLNVTGLADVDRIQRIGDAYGLHNLALEDALHVSQRPKIEPYPGNIFFAAQIIHAGTTDLVTEQVSLFLLRGVVITFQERPGDCFDSVRSRLEGSRGRIRSRSADYLFYALLDAIVDHYFPVMEDYGERLEALERDVLQRAGKDTFDALHNIQYDLLELRRIMNATREALERLLREDADGLIESDTRVYLRDCADHAHRLLDSVDMYRGISESLIDTQLSMSNQKLGEIMKFLAVVSTVFLPLNFIAALYGMNFQPGASPFNMPELTWRFGYFFALGLMGAAVVGMFVLFRRYIWNGR